MSIENYDQTNQFSSVEQVTQWNIILVFLPLPITIVNCLYR